MPPSVKDWLPEDHLAFFVLDVVCELDLAGFYAAYRADGRGGSVYDPVMMLGVLLYATARASGPRGGSSAVSLRTWRIGCWR
jgi:transposase